MPEMSVIVVNWNGRHFLETCLGALRKQTFKDFETILVDNGSEDGSVDFVRDSFPEVVTLALKNNVGFAAANNAGFAVARGNWIVLLNNDTEADINWLASIHNVAMCCSGAGTIACMMRYFDDRERIDNCGFDMTSGGSTIDLGRGEKVGPAWECSRAVFGGCGGAVAYRRSMLENVGFYDPDFFMTYEDVDLSFRAQLYGYDTVFVPEAIVYHRYRATMKRYPTRQVYFSQRNIEFVYMKNMPLKLMLRHLPHRILYEFGAAIYFVRMGAGRPFLRAKLDAIRHIPSLFRKRREIQERRVVADSKLVTLFRGDYSRVQVKKLMSAWRNPLSQRTSG